MAPLTFSGSRFPRRVVVPAVSALSALALTGAAATPAFAAAGGSRSAAQRTAVDDTSGSGSLGSGSSGSGSSGSGSSGSGSSGSGSSGSSDGSTAGQTCPEGADGSGKLPHFGRVATEPWSLQRVDLNQLKKLSTGAGTTVAVIDSGVSSVNAQLRGVVSDGGNVSGDSGSATDDPLGHGTEVAGIIAAQPVSGTDFAGLAPDAKILSIRASNSQGAGSADKLSQAIDKAVAANVDVINISQDVQSNGAPVAMSPSSTLGQAVANAVAHGIVVVASAGNEGLDQKTYPAAFPGVLAVGASDYNDERASFSEIGDFVGVAAPGVDMLTTWAGGGQCVAQGTSFSAPYVSAVAALLKSAHKDWSNQQIITRIEQTAQRPQAGSDQYTGWGVVDPVAALSASGVPGSAPTPDAGAKLDSAPISPMPLDIGTSAADRERRTATYALCTGAVLALLIGGGAVVVRDASRRRRR